MPAHPTLLPRRNADHQGVVGHVLRDHGPGRDEAIAAERDAADDRGVGADRRTAADQRPLVQGMPVDLGTRVGDVGQNAGGPEEDVVLDRRARVDRDVVLDLDVVADDAPRRRPWCSARRCTCGRSSRRRRRGRSARSWCRRRSWRARRRSRSGARSSSQRSSFLWRHPVRTTRTPSHGAARIRVRSKRRGDRSAAGRSGRPAAPAARRSRSPRRRAAGRRVRTHSRKCSHSLRSGSSAGRSMGLRGSPFCSTGCRLFRSTRWS